jgi:hypothetical protein
MSAPLSHLSWGREASPPLDFSNNGWGSSHAGGEGGEISGGAALYARRASDDRRLDLPEAERCALMVQKSRRRPVTREGRNSHLPRSEKLTVTALFRTRAYFPSTSLASRFASQQQRSAGHTIVRGVHAAVESAVKKVCSAVRNPVVACGAGAKGQNRS